MEKILALKSQLTSGAITQDQFISELAKLLASNEITQQEHDEHIKGGDDDNKPLTRKDIEALLEKERQSSADKVRTEYTQKLKDAEKARELLELEKMSEAQQAEYKRKQLEDDLEKREKALNAREVEITVLDSLSDAKLPMSFKQFFIGAESKEVASAQVKALSDVWSTELKTAVEARFADLGDKGSRGGGGGQATKKWNDYTLTEQGQLYKNDPEAAKKLALEAGIKL